MQSNDFSSLLSSWLEELKVDFSWSCKVSKIKIKFLNNNFLSFLFWMLLLLWSILFLEIRKSIHTDVIKIHKTNFTCVNLSLSCDKNFVIKHLNLALFETDFFFEQFFNYNIKKLQKAKSFQNKKLSKLILRNSNSRSSFVFLVKGQHVQQSASLGNLSVKSYFFISLTNYWTCWSVHW